MSGQWNRSNAANQPVEKKGGKSPSVMKGIIVGSVAVVVGVVCIFAFSGKSEKPVKDTGTKPAKIKEVKPPVTPKPVTNQVQLAKAEPTNAIPERNIFHIRSAEQGRVMTLMDGTVVTNKPKVIFKRDFEKSLMVAIRPGSMSRGLLMAMRSRYSDEEIVAMLKEKVVVNEDDDQTTRNVKANVQELKNRMLEAIDAGRTVDDLMNELQSEGVRRTMIQVEMRKARAEALKSDDPAEAAIAAQAVNKVLEKNNLRTYPLPKDLQPYAVESDNEAPEASETSEGHQQ